MAECINGDDIHIARMLDVWHFVQLFDGDIAETAHSFSHNGILLHSAQMRRGDFCCWDILAWGIMEVDAFSDRVTSLLLACYLTNE